MKTAIITKEVTGHTNRGKNIEVIIRIFGICVYHKKMNIN